MRVRAFVSALLLCGALRADAQSLFGRAMLEYQKYDYGSAPTSGFRQQYDLRLDRALTDTARFRIFVRADDFRGTTDAALDPGRVGSRQIQPVGELVLNMLDFHVQARGELIDTRTRTSSRESNRRIERAFGNLTWSPERLPQLTLLGQRNMTSDRAAGVDLTDDYALAGLQYQWRGLSAAAEERYAHSGDPLAGYDRKTNTHSADLNYSAAYLDGRLTVGGGVSTQIMRIDERGLGSGSSSVPTPLIINRALWAVDDTPLDSRDHPPTTIPALTDGNTTTSTGVSLGPDAVSFQNLVLDLARADRMDEIRVIVRDGAGNPLRNGGGALTWDVYSSDDGQLWSPATGASSTFNVPLSLYIVTFDLKTARWFKVVNFGVNSEETAVTEVQAFYHVEIEGGQKRSGNQNLNNATATVTAQPTRKLLLSYTGVYTRQRQELSTLPFFTTTDMENIAAIQYDVLRTVSLRGQYLKRLVRTYNGANDDADNLAIFADYKPTSKLTVTLELGRQSQMLDTRPYTIDTKAIHLSGFMLRSVSVTLDAGVQNQSTGDELTSAERQYVNLSSTVQLFPTLRALVSATTQRTTSGDPALQLLGPARDDRFYTDFIYRPGRPLMISARYGYVAGQQLSGFTQRYHIDWYPFADGTVSLGGAYDEDIDPTTNRRARRLLFNPRWMINRWASFDVNYTSFTTSLATHSQTNRSLFATLTLTR